MKITVAIPCYRSGKTLKVVVDRIRETIAARPAYDYQIVLVNDCSPDNTYEVIQTLCAQDHRIVGVDLAKNWGQANARMAAFPYIDGDIAVFMDDDGQHPVERLFELTDKIEEGYDLVTANFGKKEESALRKLTSKLAGKVFTAMGKRPQGAVSSSYFAISRMCIEKVREYSSPFPALFGYLYQFCGRITNIPMEENKRIAGHSGYNFQKRLNLWLNGFVNFTLVPLRMSTYAGVISIMLAVLTALIALIIKLIHPAAVAGNVVLSALVLFMGGCILFAVGIMGEFIGRSFMILCGKPQYVVRETLNADPLK